jgi:hypothetical protein
MVLRLKTWESRSLPGLPRGDEQSSRALLHLISSQSRRPSTVALALRGHLHHCLRPARTPLRRSQKCETLWTLHLGTLHLDGVCRAGRTVCARRRQLTTVVPRSRGLQQSCGSTFPPPLAAARRVSCAIEKGSRPWPATSAHFAGAENQTARPCIRSGAGR